MVSPTGAHRVAPVHSAAGRRAGSFCPAGFHGIQRSNPYSPFQPVEVRAEEAKLPQPALLFHLARDGNFTGPTSRVRAPARRHSAPPPPSTRAGRREAPPPAGPRLPPPADPRRLAASRAPPARPLAVARPPSPSPHARRRLPASPVARLPVARPLGRALASRRSSRRSRPRPPCRLRLPAARAAALRRPSRRASPLEPSRPPRARPMDTDDTASLSDDSGWSSSDDSDIEELLQDDDVEMVSLLIDVQEFEDRKKLMGSKMGRVTIYRNRALSHEQLMHDYFAVVPTYPPCLFRRRYRMRRCLFVKIVNDCAVASDYFKRRRSAAGIMGFSGYQKISAVMQVLAYGIPADYTDEYLRIGQDTTTESVRRFAKLVIRLYGDVYLRAPNEEDTKRLMEMNEKRGWPGMLGSLDCMHWT
nr:uncharacterized protein LOC127347322 [Lolium perenne]